MKLVNWDEFVKLPNGTMFQYKGEGNNNIYIRHDVIEADLHSSGVIDFYKQPIGFIEDIIDETFDLEWGIVRDGLFEYDRQFIVYEREDVKTLIKQISEALYE